MLVDKKILTGGLVMIAIGIVLSVVLNIQYLLEKEE